MARPTGRAGFQSGVPELGRLRARFRSMVSLTWTNVGRVADACKRGGRHLFFDSPGAVVELERVRLRAPEVVKGEEALHRQRIASLGTQLDVISSELAEKRAALAELRARVGEGSTSRGRSIANATKPPNGRKEKADSTQAFRSVARSLTSGARLAGGPAAGASRARSQNAAAQPISTGAAASRARPGSICARIGRKAVTVAASTQITAAGAGPVCASWRAATTSPSSP